MSRLSYTRWPNWANGKINTRPSTFGCRAHREAWRLAASTFLSTIVSGTNECADTNNTQRFNHGKFPDFRKTEVPDLPTLRKAIPTVLDPRNLPISFQFASAPYTQQDLREGADNTRTVRPIWYDLEASHLDAFWCFGEMLRNGCTKPDCTLRHTWPCIDEVEVLLMLSDQTRDKDSLKFLWSLVKTFVTRWPNWADG